MILFRLMDHRVGEAFVGIGPFPVPVGILKDGKRRETKVFLLPYAMCDISGNRRGFSSLASAPSSPLTPFVVPGSTRKVLSIVLDSARQP